VEAHRPPTFTVAEAAEALGRSPLAVREMVDRGRLRALRFAGAVRIPREEVVRLGRGSGSPSRRVP
jgi:excisionase family DNA binding protein